MHCAPTHFRFATRSLTCMNFIFSRICSVLVLFFIYLLLYYKLFTFDTFLSFDHCLIFPLCLYSFQLKSLISQYLLLSAEFEQHLSNYSVFFRCRIDLFTFYYPFDVSFLIAKMSALFIFI